MCVCALVPGLAHADDGGWWDSFWKWDARLTGGNTEIHLLCMDGVGRRVIGCEEWFRGIGQLLKRKPLVHRFRVVEDPKTLATVDIESFEQIKHEFNLRIGYYRNFGDRYAAPEPSIRGSINVVPTIATYYYHINKYVSVGGGMGLLTIYGERFNPFTRSFIVPASYIIHPLPEHAKWGALIVRAEIDYVPIGFSAADFGDAFDPKEPARLVSNYLNRREWHATVGVGFDLRRIGCFKGCR